MATVVNLTGGIEIGGTTLYGMDAEHALKQAAKYDYGRERDIMKWIEAVLGEKLPSKDIHESLKSGIILCRLINKIKPGLIKKYNTRAIALMEIENIKLYLEGCWKIGVPSSCLFVSSDLYKARGMNEVLNNLEALCKHAARMKDYTGPVLAIHERERPGASPSTKSKAAARKPKKWNIVETAKPRHAGELVSQEDVDIRSENLRLKQELEREKCERISLEEELDVLKSSKGSSVAPSTVATSTSENTWKNKVTSLEKQITTLERDLAAAKKTNSSPSTSSSATSDRLNKEINDVRRQLEDEKRVHQSTKRDLDRERDAIKKMQKEITELKSKVSAASSRNTPQRQSLNSNDLVVSNLKEENEMLRDLIQQLRTDLDLAVQLSKTEKVQGKKHGPNYFIIDESDETISAEIQRVEDCLRDILGSAEVEFSDVVELNQFFKVDSGRRKFTQILEALMQEFSVLDLSDNSFELVLYLINTTLTEMDTSDSNDLITAKILMRASSVLKRETDGKPVQDFIANYSVFHDISFWEELFWDELFRTHKHRSAASGMEDEDIYTLDHNLTLKVVNSLITVMLHWKSFRDEIIRFVDFIFVQTKTPDEFSTKLKDKMASDSFWDAAASAKLKDGVWKPKKLKGSRLRRKKKGSRIGSTLERRSTPSKGDTPKKDKIVSPRNVVSPRSESKEKEKIVSPRNGNSGGNPSRIKDRISQWES